MFSINNISVAFGGETLFDDVSFIINDRDRIGLVGKNGTGKSTLLRIIKGIQAPDQGGTVIPEGATVGFLPQEMAIGSNMTVREEARTAFGEMQKLEERIREDEYQIKVRTDFESESYHHLILRHAEAIERFHLIGGHLIEENLEKVLTGLGFEKDDFSRPLQTFSSGWQMRITLAKILLQHPDLILLDEPTNHLDIESIQWLEEFLASYAGAVILVSHDRAFLDNVTHRTIEISLGKIYDYKSNYSGFVVMREERLESQIATYNNQQRQIQQIERFIERFRYKSTKARQVQSKIKMLDRMDRIIVDIPDNAAIRFRFPPAPHAGKIILETDTLGKEYPQKKVLSGISFSVIKNDRIAFVGRNGEGKTTLARILAGRTEFTGKLKYGTNVVIGYFAQDQSDPLDPGKTVFQTVDEIASGDMRTRVKAILGGFLFTGEDIEKKVKVLSGGEKSRLSLARMLFTPSNLLILDEPTNHLDIRSKDVLKNALLQYDGTMILVSHDRDFLQGLTKRVFEFRNGRIKEYIGDIYDFLEQRNLKHLSELDAIPDKDIPLKVEPATRNKSDWEQRKNRDREIRRVRSKIERLEEEIHGLEQELKRLEQMLSDPDIYQQQITDGTLSREYLTVQTALTGKMELWEQTHAELDQIT